MLSSSAKKKGKKKRGKEAEKEIRLSPDILLLQCYIHLSKGLTWMLAALSNGCKFVNCPTIFNTEQERFIQTFELLQKSQVPEPLSYFQFKQSTSYINLASLATQMQFDYFEAAQKDLKKLRHCFPKDSERLHEIQQLEHVAEKNRIALNVIHFAEQAGSFPRVSFEFSHHPLFAVAVIKRS